MEAWSRLPKTDPTIRVVFALRHPADLDSACAHAAHGTVLLDRDGRTAREFNAHWRARAYGLDAEGKIVYVQPEITLDPQAPAELARVWQE
jgi:hypothetical protein